MSALDGLLLPASSSIGATLRQLQKQRRADIISHLRSLDHDAAFVAAVHEALGRPPSLANLRCGVWHVPPEIASFGHCYFKSTDGHSGKWDFSRSRLNLQVALAAAVSDVMIVDSTRTGKTYPDSLSKTVPIWCCVLNRAVGAARAGTTGSSWDTALRLPPWVPPSEVSQIDARLDGWVAILRRPALAPVLARLVAALHRPLRPRWVCPATDGSGGIADAATTASEYARSAHAEHKTAAASGSPFSWVHCVCASEVISAEAARARASYTYIQGAGDDEENWATGLRAEQWWRWRGELMSIAVRDPETAERRLHELKEGDTSGTADTFSSGLMAHGNGAEEGAGHAVDVGDGADEAMKAACSSPPCQLWGSGILIGTRQNATSQSATSHSAASPHVWQHADAVLDVGSSIISPIADEGGSEDTTLRAEGAPATSAPSASTPSTGAHPASEAPLPSYLHVPIEDEGAGKSKRAQPSKDWWQRVVFPRALNYVYSHLIAGRRVVIICERGDDRAPAVAVAALLALYADDAATLLQPETPSSRAVGKEDVKARLALLQGAYPAARVPRAYVKEINNFFVAKDGGFHLWQRPAPPDQRMVPPEQRTAPADALTIIADVEAMAVEEVQTPHAVPAGFSVVDADVAAALTKKDHGGRGVRTSLGARTLAIFARGDALFATDADCPHQGAPLELGEIEETGGALCVSCPRHGWCFELQTGWCEDIYDYGVHAYEVIRLPDQRICVADVANPQP